MRKKKLGGILCRNYPIMYINMPKSACTTIKNILYFVDNGEPFPDPLAIHADKRGLLKDFKPHKREYRRAARRNNFCFTFVREPLSRCYSAFNEKIFHQGKYSFAKYRRLLVENYNCRFPSEGDPYTIEQHSENFRCFLNFVADNMAGQTSLKPNLHWAPQSKIIRRWRVRRVIDMVGRVEKFEEGMTYMLAMAGYAGTVDLKMRFNEGPRPPFSLEEIVTPEIQEALEYIYEGDLRDFGYL